MRLALVCLTSAYVAALRCDTSTKWSRRQALVLPVFASTPLAAHAEREKGGVSWSIELPDSFAVQTQLSSIVRIRVATMLAAEDMAMGASAKLLLLPFGQQAGGSLDADEQLRLAKHFFDQQMDAKGPQMVASTMSASAARSPTVKSLSRVGDAMGYEAPDGVRYVQYGYTADKCSEPLDDGECFGSRTSLHFPPWRWMRVFIPLQPPDHLSHSLTEQSTSYRLCVMCLQARWHSAAHLRS